MLKIMANARVGSTFTEGFGREIHVHRILNILCVQKYYHLCFAKNNEIKGIKLNETEILLPQFADDTTLCLDGSEQSFNESMHTLQRCVQMSGLKMNNRLNQCSLVIMHSFKDLTQTAIVKHQIKPLRPIHRDDQGRIAIPEMRGCVNVYSRSI